MLASCSFQGCAQLNRVLAKRSGQTAEGPAATRRAGLTFQPGDGCHAEARVIGQRLLGQPALAPEVAKVQSVEKEHLRADRGHWASISNQIVQPVCSSPVRPQFWANRATTSSPRPF